MKTVTNKLIFVILHLFGIITAFAQTPPEPGGPLPPPPGEPIDEHIFILILLGVLLGIYIIYRHKLKTKAPI
jgi:hypothetical protein